MKKTLINTFITTAFIVSLGFATTYAMAGQDYFQQQMTQRLMQSKQKLQQAEAAKGVEQEKLLNEHMQMLHENMAACREMKPKVGMTEKERDEWFAEHQKIMDDLMVQMMEEHKVKMSTKPCDVVKN
jgi:predicted GH43/DUF377 family glycosyl hydrolase